MGGQDDEGEEEEKEGGEDDWEPHCNEQRGICWYIEVMVRASVMKEISAGK